MVLHGIVCLSVFMVGYRPFLNYYGAFFLMFELSTLFLNVHWFCDKTGRTGSTLQLVNGILLVGAFALVRIVFGLYSSVHFIWTSLAQWDRTKEAAGLFYLLCVANVVLNALNFYWFAKMIAAIKRRFPSGQVGGKKKD